MSQHKIWVFGREMLSSRSRNIPLQPTNWKQFTRIQTSRDDMACTRKKRLFCLVCFCALSTCFFYFGDAAANLTSENSKEQMHQLSSINRNVKENFVIDVGMNTGQDTLAYLKQGFNVLSVEANPLLIEQVKENQDIRNHMSDGSLKILGVGISGINDAWGTVPFYVNVHNDVFSSFDKSLGCRSADWNLNQKSDTDSCNVQQIFVLSCKDIVSNFGVPVYLKIDIEGKDLDCLQSFLGDKYLLPRYMSVEGLPNTEFGQIFLALGYKKFKVVDQSNFGNGASGPFGEDSIDFHKNKEWSTWKEIAERTYETVVNGTVSHWYDIHASL